LTRFLVFYIAIRDALKGLRTCGLASEAAAHAARFSQG